MDIYVSSDGYRTAFLLIAYAYNLLGVWPCYQYNIGITKRFLLRDTYRLSQFDVPISYKPTDSRTVRYMSRQRLTYIPEPARAQIAKVIGNFELQSKSIYSKEINQIVTISSGYTPNSPNLGKRRSQSYVQCQVRFARRIFEYN